MENKFEKGTIDMPEKLIKPLEGEETLTPEELAGGPISNKETIPTEPKATEQINEQTEEELLKDFDSIKSYIENKTGAKVKPGWLEMAKKQFENKVNNPNFTKEQAIQDTIGYLKEKMGISDDLKAFREAAKIPYRQAESLVNQFKAGTNEIKYEDVMAKLQEAREAVGKAKDNVMMAYLEQWTNDIEDLNNARS